MFNTRKVILTNAIIKDYAMLILKGYI